MVKKVKTVKGVEADEVVEAVKKVKTVKADPKPIEYESGTAEILAHQIKLESNGIYIRRRDLRENKSQEDLIQYAKNHQRYLSQSPKSLRGSYHTSLPSLLYSQTYPERQEDEPKTPAKPRPLPDSDSFESLSN